LERLPDVLPKNNPFLKFFPETFVLKSLLGRKSVGSVLGIRDG
jgi:hypothetical protein